MPLYTSPVAREPNLLAAAAPLSMRTLSSPALFTGVDDGSGSAEDAPLGAQPPRPHAGSLPAALVMVDTASQAAACPMHGMELGSTEAAVQQPLTGGGTKRDANLDLNLAISARDSFQDSFPASSTTGDAEMQEAAQWRKIGLKIALSIATFIVGTLLLEHFAERSIAKASRQLMDKIGLPGLFVAVLLADGLPQPFTYVPLIFIAVKGDVPKPVVFAVCACASYAAALLGYGAGTCIRTTSRGANLFNRLQEEHPYVPELMRTRGAAGVALAAALPVPLAVATWTAGACRVDFKRFMLAGLCRWPKIAVFVLLSRSPRPPPHVAAADTTGGSPVEVWMTS